MMNIWIYIMLLMFLGSFIIQLTPLLYYVEAVFIVNLLIFIIAGFILKHDRSDDFRANMLFMGGLTIINVLADLNILSAGMSWIAVGALLVWSMAGGGRN